MTGIQTSATMAQELLAKDRLAAADAYLGSVALECANANGIRSIAGPKVRLSFEGQELLVRLMWNLTARWSDRPAPQAGISADEGRGVPHRREHDLRAQFFARHP